jgi:hypothetical protein
VARAYTSAYSSFAEEMLLTNAAFLRSPEMSKELKANALSVVDTVALSIAGSAHSYSLNNFYLIKRRSRNEI